MCFMISLISIRLVMGNRIKRMILEARKYFFLLIHIIEKLMVLLCQALR